MIDISSMQSALITAWGTFWQFLLPIAPLFLGTAVLLIIGFTLSYWLNKLVSEFLKSDNVKKYLDFDSVESYLRKSGIGKKFEDLAGSVLGTVVFIVFFISILNFVSEDKVNQALLNIILSIPTILFSLLIFVSGILLSRILNSAVRLVFAFIDPNLAKFAGKIAQYSLSLVTIFVSLSVLDFPVWLKNAFLQGLGYTLVLALGISIGLGAKDFVSEVLYDFYKRIKK